MKKNLLFIIMGFFSLNNAQLATVTENFDSFSQIFAFPQNGWTTATANVYAIRIGVMSNNVNRFVTSNGTNTLDSQVVNIPQYLISPQIIKPDGSKYVSFDVYLTAQSTGGTSVEAGLLTNPSDLSTFTSLGAPYSVQSTTSVTLTYNVPNSNQQYIAFKFITGTLNTQTVFDNVNYGANLSVNENGKGVTKLQFAVNSYHLIFTGKKNVKEIKIYNAAGRNVYSGKAENNMVDISQLSTGIYFFETQNNDGSTLKSKFVKK